MSGVAKRSPRAGLDRVRSFQHVHLMHACGSWNPRTFARMRPTAASFDSAIPFVNRHSIVASVEWR